MLAPSSGVESESTVSEFRETEKENFCAVFTNSIERAREIRKSNVGRKKKSVMQVQSCCFANINLSFFFFVVLVVVVVVLACLSSLLL